MQSSNRTKILNCICIVLIITACAIRLLGHRYNTFSYNSIICMLFSASAIIWIYQLQRRLIQPEVRKNLIVCALLILFWMILRTLKYEFLPDGHITARYLWYIYYIPQTFCVLLIFFSVLHIGMPQNRSISRFWKLLYIPSTIIVLGILTNDFHQLAFRFPQGLENWDNNKYIHGPFYYGAVFWIAILFLAILVIVFAKCAVPENRRKIWLPAMPLIFGIVYCTFFFINPKNLLVETFLMPEFVCFIFASFTECLILAHLIPSNDNYGDFWNASSIGAGIIDKNGVIRYKSKSSIPVTKEQVYKASEQAVFLENGDIVLRSHPIHGGFGYWTKDISTINQLNRKLENLGDVLAEENAILDAENKLAEERIRIEQQNKLYDDIAKSVNVQLDKLSSLIELPGQSEEEFESTMKYACILNSYIKRMSNMLLLFHQNKLILSDELCLAVSESLEYVRMYGIKAHFEHMGKSRLPGECILLTYEVFEAVLESGIPGTDAVLVNLEISNKSINLRIEMNSPKLILPQDFMRDKIKAPGGNIQIETEQLTEYVSFTIPLGGEYE